MNFLNGHNKSPKDFKSKVKLYKCYLISKAEMEIDIYQDRSNNYKNNKTISKSNY